VETRKIDVELPDGSQKVFFKKGATGPVGCDMMKGAFESESALYSFIPEHVPKPVAYGSYQERADTHFYIAEFADMTDDHPNATAYADVFATLHTRSMGRSPGGKFGFHIDTHLADIPQDNTWNSSWERFWDQTFRSLCEKEEAARGPDDDLTRLKEVFHQLVIPRYLRPLESDGRVIHTVLLHNDGWPGNIMHKENKDGPLCLFDSAAYWGHNEGGYPPLRHHMPQAPLTMAPLAHVLQWIFGRPVPTYGTWKMPAKSTSSGLSLQRPTAITARGSSCMRLLDSPCVRQCTPPSPSGAPCKLAC